MSQFAPASSVLDGRVYWNQVGPSLFKIALRLRTVQKFSVDAVVFKSNALVTATYVTMVQPQDPGKTNFLLRRSSKQMRLASNVNRAGYFSESPENKKKRLNVCHG